RHLGGAPSPPHPHGRERGAAAQDGRGQRKQLREADKGSDHQLRRRNGQGLVGSGEPERERPNRGKHRESFAGTVPAPIHGTHQGTNPRLSGPKLSRGMEGFLSLAGRSGCLPIKHRSRFRTRSPLRPSPYGSSEVNLTKL